MIDRLNDPDRFEADQRVHETRDALSKDIPRNRELQDIADVIDEDDLEDMDADGVDHQKQ
jgi:hypothetical protein